MAQQSTGLSRLTQLAWTRKKAAEGQTPPRTRNEAPGEAAASPSTTPPVGEPVNQGTLTSDVPEGWHEFQQGHWGGNTQTGSSAGTSSGAADPSKDGAAGKMQEGAMEPTAAQKTLQDIAGGMSGTGPFQFKLKQVFGKYEDQIKQMAEGGATDEQINKLIADLEGETTKGHEKGAKKWLSDTISQLKALGADPTQTSEGPQNPFAAGTVQEEFGPQIEAITEQGMTEADQEFESQKEIREHTGELYGGIGERVDEAGERIEGIQDELTGSYQQLQQDIDNLQQSLPDLAERATAKFDDAIEQTMSRVDSAQALIDSKESNALGQVMEGKSAAMQAAVQGMQGQINSQIAQINANPDLTPAQKAQMTAQVRMQGTAAMAPAVGQTILQFNDLYARTATSFGQMTTQIQGQGISAMAQLSGAQAQAFSAVTVEANKIAAGLMNTRSQADANYASAMSNLESIRTTVETTGDTLRAQLLPGMGTPYPKYHDVMVQDLQMNFDLAKTEFQSMMGAAGMEIYAWMAKQSSNSAQSQMWSNLAQSFGGPLAQLIGFGGVLAGMGQQQQGGPPSPPGTSGLSF